MAGALKLCPLGSASGGDSVSPVREGGRRITGCSMAPGEEQTWNHEDCRVLWFAKPGEGK